MARFLAWSVIGRLASNTAYTGLWSAQRHGDGRWREIVGQSGRGQCKQSRQL